MGPPPRLTADRPVVSLERCGPATRTDASSIRRSFRAWIAEWADADTADDLALAVYEALANVVDHAYATADGPGQMRLWAAVSPPLFGGRELVVTVSDDGAWRRSTGRGWRGRGLPLMHTLTRATVLCGPGGTTVQMRSRVSP
ncbi:ATP-binding protein [Actinomycetospora termitidis]|uniref:ATP-binding protein n=1 Tax=Actinomycetospora termitidis TaxID=3053470 RepID=A0ABT7M7A5_9PSEU|nr:ATP-binding protein [Actinomycetospora sp. Odt1-22]MDL5155922.1 ATP-binding protein [Actinomycetospora sp. Odt1-22]